MINFCAADTLAQKMSRHEAVLQIHDAARASLIGNFRSKTPAITVE